MKQPIQDVKQTAPWPACSEPSVHSAAPQPYRGAIVRGYKDGRSAARVLPKGPTSLSSEPPGGRYDGL